jgi:tRNA-specific 2-thiouridylase
MSKGNKRVAVALSGGLDSAFAALSLIDGGWQVEGIHLILPLPAREKARKAKAVKAIGERLRIPIHFLDVRDLFYKRVVDYFVRAYSSGITPNPCVVCNHLIKFNQMGAWIEENGIEYMATGHYARTRRSSNGTDVELLKGKDANKDQSYFLHRLNRHHLSRLIFPVGYRKKDELRREAKIMDLPDAVRHESQEICFIPDNDYRSFLNRHVGRSSLSSGTIVDLDGNILGIHSGTHAYTIGQRHGLGIASTEPLYVYEIRAKTREVVVGPRETLYSKTLYADDCTWIGARPSQEELRAEAQIRYRHEPASGTLTLVSADTVYFEFDDPQWAITPGQALVCYDGEKVLGGGWIRKTK